MSTLVFCPRYHKTLPSMRKLGWQNVFETSRGPWLNMEAARYDAAQVSYPYVIWDDKVYRTRDGMPTDWTRDKIHSEPSRSRHPNWNEVFSSQRAAKWWGDCTEVGVACKQFGYDFYTWNGDVRQTKDDKIVCSEASVAGTLPGGELTRKDPDWSPLPKDYVPAVEEVEAPADSQTLLEELEGIAEAFVRIGRCSGDSATKEQWAKLMMAKKNIGDVVSSLTKHLPKQMLAASKAKRIVEAEELALPTFDLAGSGINRER